jgi:predicted glycoside hydrolase/deacetylase ChbG (UPF0249 family)
MANSICLIVNADDFGQSPGINLGIMTAHERGIVTSASLIVRGPAAARAAEDAQAHPRLSVGLHIDLGEWAYRAGAWVELYRRVDADNIAAVEAEVAQQLDAFRRLVGRNPTHLDSHQHVHRKDPVRQIVQELGVRLRIPVRHFTPGIAYCGDFYGQDDYGHSYPHLVRAASLVAILERLTPGVTELCCHPGGASGEPGDTMYLIERRQEMDALCDPRVREAVDALGIKLISFRDLGPEAT